MEQREQIRVLLVDDHSIVRQGVRAFLAVLPDILVVGEAASGQEALHMVEEFAPDVVLLDLVLPGMNGVEVTHQIKRQQPKVQIVVLTSYHDDDFIFPTLRAGALSYVLKDIHARDLAETIRKAARGESVLHPSVATRLVKNLRGEKNEAPNLFNELSERELEVLRLIARGLSNAAIATQLVISEQTVKGHVSNILSKLHMTDRTQAAVSAWQQGLIRRDS
ncbi:MAG: response regulator transcription factor [Ktedonobacteraceae bacterium]